MMPSPLYRLQGPDHPTDVELGLIDEADTVAMIARCAHGQRPKDQPYDHEAAVRRVLGLQANDPIVPYVSSDPAHPVLVGLVWLGILGSSVALVYGVSALVSWVW